MQDSYLDEKWQIPFEESADQMLKKKGKTVHFVLILSQNAEADRGRICRVKTCPRFLSSVLSFQVQLQKRSPVCFI